MFQNAPNFVLFLLEFNWYLEKLSVKQLDSHDSKYQPENETHQEYVEDTGNGLDEGVYHNLEKYI